MLQFVAGLGLGIGAIGAYAYLKSHEKSKPREETPECIELFKILDYLRSDEVQRILSEDKKRSLFAKKTLVTENGKEKFQVSLRFFNSDKNEYDSNLPQVVYISEKMDDLLKEKFGLGSVWAVQEAVL